MGQKEHTLLAPGAIRRVQLLDRLMKGRTGPKLPPREDDAAIRRTAARVRAGVVPGLDPAIPPAKVAAALETSLEQDEVVRNLAATLRERDEVERESQELERADRAARLAASLLRLKSMPETDDPESPVAKKIGELNRRRRNELGRPPQAEEEGVTSLLHRPGTLTEYVARRSSRPPDRP